MMIGDYLLGGICIAVGLCLAAMGILQKKVLKMSKGR